jgi:DNA ligase (NAD+)
MVLRRWLSVFVLVWASVVGFAADSKIPIEAEAVARERLRFLGVEIARHDTLYFQKAAPKISDLEYDTLKREFEALRAKFPDEAAQLTDAMDAIGDDRSEGWGKHRHRVPMLSLEKAYTEAALRAFDADVREKSGDGDIAYVVEPKFDGLAISAIYERGKLARLVTRGNGHEGDDVTMNARAIRALPRTLLAGEGADLPAFVEVRGEVFLTFAEFERINREREDAGEAPYASSRNLAAGTLKSLAAGDEEARRLEVVFYALGACDSGAAMPASQTAMLAQIAAWGLPAVERVRRVDTIDAAWAEIEELGRERARLPYPIDGVVVKIDSRATQQKLGESERAPRWAVAYKFTAERATTRLQAITIQVGRTGVLTPVAELEPVVLGGATIARASLHNADEIARRDLRLGDAVVVERAGEIIPAIVAVDFSAREAGSVPYVFPAACPACGRAAMRRDGEAAWRCVNARCAAQVKRQLLHFASQQAMGIRGLGEATIDALVDSGKVDGVADVYRLTRADLLAIPRFGEDAAEALLRAIEASRRVELWRVVHGLGIRGVGAVSAKALARHFGGLSELAAASEADLRAVNGIGAETARAVAEYFGEGGGRETVQALLAGGVEPRSASTASIQLAGKTFVLTGKLPGLTRAEAVRLIEAAGGEVTSAVSRRTDFVVAGENAGEPLTRARQLNVRAIDETGLRELVGVPEAAGDRER